MIRLNNCLTGWSQSLGRCCTAAREVRIGNQIDGLGATLSACIGMAAGVGVAVVGTNLGIPASIALASSVPLTTVQSGLIGGVLAKDNPRCAMILIASSSALLMIVETVAFSTFKDCGGSCGKAGLVVSGTQSLLSIGAGLIGMCIKNWADFCDSTPLPDLENQGPIDLPPVVFQDSIQFSEPSSLEIQVEEEEDSRADEDLSSLSVSTRPNTPEEEKF